MPRGLVVLGVLAFVRLPFMNTLAQQPAQPEFAQARYVHRAGRGPGIQHELPA